MARWPVVLRASTPAGQVIELGPLHRRDRREWQAVRQQNRPWLEEWEATSPDGRAPGLGFPALVRHYNREARAGRMVPFVIRSEERIIGQMHLFGLSWGSLLSCAAGYWVSQSVAGRGIAPTALAASVDFALDDLGLHRVEVNIRPDNAASLAVVRKLGFRDEGLRERYLHINGAWRDHRTFALTREDLGGTTLLERFHTNHNSHIGDTPPHVPGGGAEGT
ncbi:GNAT family protein [Knoellia sp. 3-2P3]|uniref:GNAT family N-acetyltransferase n=1 Tax=unclassified Knoellia TaxID=2618719 RepID=UPI0023DB6890|nr:GNAT family protein [Knoellia sp. 3-2P3]MDF2093643.1 GNAT family protein [Knoellia sp. 3-2P3]